MIIDSHVDLAGFVASEPSFKRLENGTSTAKLRVAYTERRFSRETGEWADGPTSFVTVLCWRTLADNVAISLRKGDPSLPSYSRTRRAAGETAAEGAGALRLSGNGHPASPASGGPGESADGLEPGPDGREPGPDQPAADEPGLAGAATDGPDGAGDGVLNERAVAEFAGQLDGVPA